MRNESYGEGMSKHLSPLSVWAFSIGTSIGWGSFVITGNTYLLKAGPAGSILGLLCGALVMLVVARCYAFMMNRHPSSGGIYTCARDVLGYDYAFLVAWFLALTYIAVFWANATSLPLFIRYFLGDVLRFGLHYHIFGYEVFLTEVFLIIAAMILTGLLCSCCKKSVSIVMSVLALLFSVSIIICLLTALVKHNQTEMNYSPAFVPDTNALRQVVKITLISPWAFIGFENISHLVPEFNFSVKKSAKILYISVFSTTVLYAAVMILSVSAYPPEYSSWFEYISDLKNIDGLKGLPAFYAANYYMGMKGVNLLMTALLSLIVTSLIGNLYALSRLLYAICKDEIMNKRYAVLNKKKLPGRAIWLIVTVSVFVPFLGRTAIGWIVDVTTIGATIIYGFLCFITWKDAQKLTDSPGQKSYIGCGITGSILMIVFLVFLILPSLFVDDTNSSLAHESFFLFVSWAVLGFVVFHSLLKRDTDRRFGKSVVVWAVLLSFVLILTLIWMIESDRNAANEGLLRIQRYVHGAVNSGGFQANEEAYLRYIINDVFIANVKSILISLFFFVLSTSILFSNFFIMQKREREQENELGKVRSIANTDPLTGVKSKTAYVTYEHRLNEELSEDSDIKFSVVVCDVNNLKYVNDTLGHKAGDEYIMQASRLICAVFKHSPVFRTGGDEFVVILRGTDYEHRAEILKDLNAQVEANQKAGKVVVSAGISDFDSSKESAVLPVFERADALMYARKKELKGLRQ